MKKYYFDIILQSIIHELQELGFYSLGLINMQRPLLNDPFCSDASY